MTQGTPFNVLFLCTDNSSRSILAESIPRKDGCGRFNAFSAGSQPKGEVNPMALEVLAEFGYPTEGMWSKSWEEYAVSGAPVWISCSPSATRPRASRARCGRASPSPGTGASRTRATRRAAPSGSAPRLRRLRCMKNRVTAFTALPLASLERSSLTSKVRQIGQIEGASSPRSDVA